MRMILLVGLAAAVIVSAGVLRPQPEAKPKSRPPAVSASLCFGWGKERAERMNKAFETRVSAAPATSGWESAEGLMAVHVYPDGSCGIIPNATVTVPESTIVAQDVSVGTYTRVTRELYTTNDPQVFVGRFVETPIVAQAGGTS